MLAYLKMMLRQSGFRLYSRPYELNIVGVRSNTTASNRFDDTLHVFYASDRSLNNDRHEVFPITTDPGTFWLNNPMMQKGTAILAAGQYLDAYQIGMHRGKYEALVQRKPVTIIRDYDRDAVLDFWNGTTETGWFGINIHRASIQGTTQSIDKYSAGCQVFANSNDFTRFMQLCRQHRQLYGNKFTYTLLDQRAKVRTLRRTILTAGAILTLTAATTLAVVLGDKK
jgi:hypothetical protein